MQVVPGKIQRRGEKYPFLSKKRLEDVMNFTLGVINHEVMGEKVKKGYQRTQT